MSKTLNLAPRPPAISRRSWARPWPRATLARLARSYPKQAVGRLTTEMPAAAPATPSVARAAEGTATVVPDRPVLPSLGALLAGHILHDGEVVLLILKPSRWMILFSVMRFAAFVAIVLIAANLWLERRYLHVYAETAALALVGRVMWSVLQWMGRLYVLTDYRIVRLAGVFGVEVFDCPLRKVGQTRLVCSFRERLWRLGSIEILPADNCEDGEGQSAVWQTVRRPGRVHEQILAAIARAKTGGAGGIGAGLS